MEEGCHKEESEGRENACTWGEGFYGQNGQILGTWGFALRDWWIGPRPGTRDEGLKGLVGRDLRVVGIDRFSGRWVLVGGGK